MLADLLGTSKIKSPKWIAFNTSLTFERRIKTESLQGFWWHGVDLLTKLNQHHHKCVPWGFVMSPTLLDLFFRGICRKVCFKLKWTSDDYCKLQVSGGSLSWSDWMGTTGKSPSLRLPLDNKALKENVFTCALSKRHKQWRWLKIRS